MTTAADLTSAAIPRLIRRMAIPAGTGFFFNTMFNVVDTWYGGRISTAALAAMSLSFPVFFIMLAVGAGVSTGATALIGNALGRGDRIEARAYILQSFSFALLHALLLTLLGVMLSSRIFSFMGATGEYLDLATSYMNVIFCGSSFFLLNFVMNAILNSHGNTTSYRNFLIAGFFLNLILDPLLLYGAFGLPGMGLPGVALATILIQCLGNFYLFHHVARLATIADFRITELAPDWQRYKQLARQGFPAMLNMLTVSLGIFVITWYIGRYGRDVVAAYGIATRIEQIALLPVMGLNVSTLALSAQNFGAGRIDRIRETVKVSLLFGVFLTLIGTIAALIFTNELMALFTLDTAVIKAGVRFLRVEAFVFAAYVILYVCTSALQGMKKPFFALWLGIYRQIACPVLAFHLLSVVLGWGLMGIWLGILVVTWSAAIIAVGYVFWVVSKLEKEMIVK